MIWPFKKKKPKLVAVPMINTTAFHYDRFTAHLHPDEEKRLRDALGEGMIYLVDDEEHGSLLVSEDEYLGRAV